MRILFVITRSELGGAQAVVLTYLRSLAGQADLALATGEEGFLAEEARALGIDVYVVPELVVPIAPRLDWQAVLALRRIICCFRPDLVHAHSSKAGLIGRIAASLAGVPSVFTAHGFAFTENAGLVRRMMAIPSEWIATRLGRAVIAVSDYDGDLAVRCRVLPRDQVNVIHNGLPDVSFRACPAAGSPVNIVMVARFAPPKAHDSVLQALRGVKGDFRLWLIGEGPNQAQVRTNATKLGLADHVVFMGARSNVPELLAKAHIFVLASNYEGLPISILEAMRAGLPVVASDVGGVRECVRENETGFLIRRADVESMRSCLCSLIASPSLRDRMGKSGRKLFEDKFTETVMIEKTMEVYASVLGNSSQRKGLIQRRRQPQLGPSRGEAFLAINSGVPNPPPIETPSLQ